MKHLRKYEGQLDLLRKLVDFLNDEVAAREELLAEIRKARADSSELSPSQPTFDGFCRFLEMSEAQGEQIATLLRSAEKIRFELQARKITLVTSGRTGAAIRLYSGIIKRALRKYLRLEEGKRVYLTVKTP